MSLLQSTLDTENMVTLLPGIRNTVRALIMHEEAILLQHKVYPNHSERYVLPGGAPHLGETLTEALQRECLEELGCSVEVKELLYVADFFKTSDSESRTVRHQVEFIFRCKIPEDYIPHNGEYPDKHQIDVVWLMRNEIDDKPFYPYSLRDVIVNKQETSPVYLGLIEE